MSSFKFKISNLLWILAISLCFESIALSEHKPHECESEGLNMMRFLTQDMEQRPVFSGFRNKELNKWLFHFFEPTFKDASEVPFRDPDEIGRSPYKILTFRHKRISTRQLHFRVELISDFEDFGERAIPEKGVLSDDYPVKFSPKTVGGQIAEGLVRDLLSKYAAVHDVDVGTNHMRPEKPDRFHDLSRLYGPYLFEPLEMGPIENNLLINLKAPDYEQFTIVTAMIFEDQRHPKNNRWVQFPYHLTLLDAQEWDHSLALKMSLRQGGDLSRRYPVLWVKRGTAQEQVLHHRRGDRGFIEERLEQRLIGTERLDNLRVLEKVSTQVTKISSQSVSELLKDLRPEALHPSGHVKTAEAKVTFKEGTTQSGIDLEFTQFHNGVPLLHITYRFQSEYLTLDIYRHIRSELILLLDQPLTFDGFNLIRNRVESEALIEIQLRVFTYEQSSKIFVGETLFVNVKNKTIRKTVDNPHSHMHAGLGFAYLDIFFKDLIKDYESPFQPVHILNQSLRARRQHVSQTAAELGLEHHDLEVDLDAFDLCAGEGFINSRVAYQRLLKDFPQLSSSSDNPIISWFFDFVEDYTHTPE